MHCSRFESVTLPDSCSNRYAAICDSGKQTFFSPLDVSTVTDDSPKTGVVRGWFCGGAGGDGHGAGGERAGGDKGAGGGKGKTGGVSPVALASALLFFLHRLPEPLLTFRRREAFLACEVRYMV